MNLRFLLSCIFTVQVVLLSISFIEAASIRKRREDDTVVTASVSTSGEDNAEARIGINVNPGGGITLPGTGTGQVINQNTVIKGPTAIYGGGTGGGKPKKPPGPVKCTSTKRCKNKIGKPRRPPPARKPVVQPQPVAGTGGQPIAVYNGLQDEGSEDESENAHDESVESSSDAQDVSEDEDADASVDQDQDASEEQDHDQEQDAASEEQDANEEQDEDQPAEAQADADEDE